MDVLRADFGVLLPNHVLGAEHDASYLTAMNCVKPSGAVSVIGRWLANSSRNKLFAACWERAILGMM